MDPPEFRTFRDLISEKGDFVILVTLLWTPQYENPNGASDKPYLVEVNESHKYKILEFSTK